MFILPGPIHVKPNCWANEVPALVPTSCFQTAAGMNMFMFKFVPFGNGSHAPPAPQLICVPSLPSKAKYKLMPCNALDLSPFPPRTPQNQCCFSWELFSGILCVLSAGNRQL